MSSVTDMSHMFSMAWSFNQDIDMWNVTNVKKMNGMFAGSGFNRPLNQWNTANLQEMVGMFFLATNFNQPLDNWNVSNVTNMSILFSNANNFNQNLGNWDITYVVNMFAMLDNTAISVTNYDSILSSWTKKPHQQNVSLGVNQLKFCAQQDRSSLINDGWSFNGDTLSSNCLNVSINEALSIMNIKAYPNPAKDFLMVELPSESPLEIELYDLNGRLLKSQYAFERLSVIDLSNFQSGTYMLRVGREKRSIVVN